jgi:hypothetical protein
MTPARLENLLSLACKGVLILIPVLFAVTHIAADGVTCNYATGEKFNPLFDLVSVYASRSPAGWAMVACMVGFAFVMGFVSWHAAKRRPGLLAWFTAVVAAIAMVKMLEVAWVPIKPDKETFALIQQEMARTPTHETMLKIWGGGLNSLDLPVPEGVTSPAYLKSLQSHWIHQKAISGARFLILATIMGACLLWESKGPDNKLSSYAQCMALIWIVVGLLGREWLPGFGGLTQRFTYLGIYLWMLIVVWEIEQVRKRVGEANGGTGSQLGEVPK